MKKELENFKWDNINWFVDKELLETSWRKPYYEYEKHFLYHEDVNKNDLFWFNSKLVNVDEKDKKYATIYKEWLLKKEQKFSFTHAEQLKQLEDCFTYFKNLSIKSINFSLKWKRQEVEKFDNNIDTISADNDDIKVKTEKLNKAITNLNEEITNLEQKKYGKFKNIFFKIITFGFYNNNKKIKRKINQIQNLKEKKEKAKENIEIDLNKYSTNLANNCINISKLKKSKKEFLNEYDKKIQLKNNVLFDLEKILTFIITEKENIVANKINRKKSKDSGISDSFKEDIDAFAYFIEGNSINLQNQSLTSSIKSSSPKI
ncbi:hypothetical protein [Spiroplasma endosymbiont of Polydrusus pterygomalis]|uniref:hypothetical protein n=1 Tax=Spiroplasma endosymbiont of Polydrusus pterygomalis TaxID=3139327 RepID=UPI003CCA8F89